MEPETKAGDRSPKAGMDQPARETAGVLKLKELEVEAEVVVGGSEEASAPPLLAHPCSLLQLLLSACAGCLGLQSGYCSDDAAKPAAKGDNDAAAPAVAEPPREGAGGGGGDGEADGDGTPSGRPDSPRQGGGGDIHN